MEAKWLFVVFGILFTAILLSGQLFIGTYLSDQDRKHFEANQNRSESNFERSMMIHDFLFDNMTDLKNAWDPILATIDNVTEMRQQQELHYNETKNMFEVLQAYSNGDDRVDREIQHQQLLLTINETLPLLLTNNNGSGTVVTDSETQEQNHELLVSINKSLSALIQDIPPTLATVR